MNIAVATERDLDAIDEIERHSFSSPWSREAFAGELAREWARLDVARDRDRVIAFCNYWIVVSELHIHTIAVHPDFRGRGIATGLVQHVLGQAASAGCLLAVLEVRRSNRPAIVLYEHAGFRTVHVRAGYYQDNGEDALVMLRELGRAASP